MVKPIRTPDQPSWPIILWWGLIIIFLSFVLHELGHALAAKWLGYAEVEITLNRAGPTGGYETNRHRLIGEAAGPAVTLLIALIGTVYAKAHGSIVAYLFVLASFFIRIPAQIASFFAPNDEMVVSQALQLPSWLVPVMMLASLAGLTAIAWSGPRPRAIISAVAALGFTVGMLVIVGTEPLLPKMVI